MNVKMIKCGVGINEKQTINFNVSVHIKNNVLGFEVSVNH